MSAPIRVVPHLWELSGIICDMMHYDLGDGSLYDPDELEDYVEQLYQMIQDAKQQYIDEIGGYTL